MKKPILILICAILLITLSSCSNTTAYSAADIEAVRNGITAKTIESILLDTFSGNENIKVDYRIETQARATQAYLIATASFNGYQTDSLYISGTIDFSFAGDIDNNTFTASTYTAVGNLKISSGNSNGVDTKIEINETYASASAIIAEDEITAKVEIKHIPAASITIGNETKETEAENLTGSKGLPPSGGGSTGDVEVTQSAPIPEFLSESITQSTSSAIKAKAAEPEPDFTPEECYEMYRYLGGPAIKGFSGTTENHEIKASILGNEITLTWTENDGIYTYTTTSQEDSKNIALEIIYNSNDETYNYIQAVRGQFDVYHFDAYIVTTAENILYDESESSWDGSFKAYITQRETEDDGPYLFNNITSGIYHSDDYATGIFSFKLDHRSSETNDNPDDFRSFNPDDVEFTGLSQIEIARKLIAAMDDVATTMTTYNYQIAYTKDNNYYLFPPKDSYINNPEGAREACIAQLTMISSNWNIEENLIPVPENIQ